MRESFTLPDPETIDCASCGKPDTRGFHPALPIPDEPLCWSCTQDQVECDACGGSVPKHFVVRSDQGEFCRECRAMPGVA